jgi:putative hydrolase of the HAD superfamily
MNEKITHIFFDLDETLHDKRSTLKKSSERLWHSFKLSQYCSLELFQLKFIYENEIIQSKEKVFNSLANEFSFNHIEIELKEMFDSTFHLDCVAFPLMNDTLENLDSKGYKLGCITNGRNFFQRNKIKSLNLDRLFSTIVTSGEFGIKKPDPLIFNHAISLAKTQPKNSIFCGDNPKADILPAKELGFTTVFKSNSGNTCKEADYSFSTFNHFNDIITKLS